MLRDYYIALGVHRDASAEEILDAYRNLARTYHPDLNPSDPEAEKRFEEVQAAFEVVSDPERRAAYDRTEQSFATVRRSASRLRDAGDDTQSVVRAFAAVRRQSRRRPSLLVWQGSVYVPAMIDVTIAWLIVMLVGILLLVIARSSCTVIEPLSSEEIKSAHEQASAFMFFGKSLCVGATLVYGIVMLVLLREHSSQ